ncbi:flagellar hook-basal body complex protein FliE [uncultured Microbacterium sp.]|uniref:flagellar hook-basal body complex protein FliE n=1 Tax=uncultured Microbacterium sp. TaxID=191216 RepID=UPI0025E99724|nr:flagellar hook-basal body complex protein FliE [uncultured Microbacterium sp.]
MSIPLDAVAAPGVAPLAPLSFERAEPTADGGATPGAAAFGRSLTTAVEDLQRLQSTSNDLAVKAVTGDLDDIHQATIASARAGVALDLMVAVRDRGVAAFTEIMRMQA